MRVPTQADVAALALQNVFTTYSVWAVVFTSGLLHNMVVGACHKRYVVYI